MGNPLEPVTSAEQPVHLPWLLAAVNITGGLVFGYNAGIIAPALVSMTNENSALKNSSTQQGILTASMLLGAMIGSLFGGSLGDALGRKKSAILLGLLTFIGCIGSSVFSEIWIIVLFREVVGVGVGLSSVICPVYVGELAPAHLKGALGSTFQMAITLGILLAYIAGLIFTAVNWQYHAMFGIGALPGIMMMCIGIIMPEPQGAKDSYGEIGNHGPSPYILLFTTHSKFMLIGLMLAVTLQLTGINAIINFAPTIFQSAGLDDENATLFATVGVGAWNFVTTLGALFLVERVGRRVLILSGLVIMTVANVVAGILFIFSGSKVAGIMAIPIIFVFIAGFEISIGCLFWPLLTEIFPPGVRDAGASLMNGIQWTFNIILALFFLPLSDLIGQFTVFFIFALFGVLCFAFLWFYLPETRAEAIE